MVPQISIDKVPTRAQTVNQTHSAGMALLKMQSAVAKKQSSSSNEDTDNGINDDKEQTSEIVFDQNRNGAVKVVNAHMINIMCEK